MSFSCDLFVDNYVENPTNNHVYNYVNISRVMHICHNETSG